VSIDQLAVDQEISIAFGVDLGIEHQIFRLQSFLRTIHRQELTAYNPTRVPLSELVKRRADERYQDLPPEELAKKLAIRQSNLEMHTKDKELKDKARTFTGHCLDLEQFMHFHITMSCPRYYWESHSLYSLFTLPLFCPLFALPYVC
jgi:hypothetical protein